MKTAAVLSIGGNLGDRRATLQSAIEAIDSTKGIQVVASSEFYESVAITLSGPDTEQPSYLNAAVKVLTSLKPKALLARLNEIEHQFGRVRLLRWAPRSLDIDIITYGTELIETKSLIVPHPRAFERSFVLVPWLSIDPDAVLPGHGPVKLLVADLTDEVVVAS